MPMKTATASVTPLVYQAGEREIALAALTESIDGWDPHSGEDWLIALNRVANRLAEPGSMITDYHDLVTLIGALAPYEYDHDAQANRPGVSAVIDMTSLAIGPEDDGKTHYLCPHCHEDDVVCTTGSWFVEVTYTKEATRYFGESTHQYACRGEAAARELLAYFRTDSKVASTKAISIPED